MPNKDKTGPKGKGVGIIPGSGNQVENNIPDSTGTGLGQGLGRARGSGRGGGNRPGRGPGRGSGRRFRNQADSPGGNCVCPSCGHTVNHELGQPCYEQKCPNCGTPLIRE